MCKKKKGVETGNEWVEPDLITACIVITISHCCSCSWLPPDLCEHLCVSYGSNTSKHYNHSYNSVLRREFVHAGRVYKINNFSLEDAFSPKF